MQLGDIKTGFLRLRKSPSGVLRPRISANFQIKNFKQTNHYKIKTLPYLLWSYDGKVASFDRTSLKRCMHYLFPLETATHRSMNSLKHKRSLLWWRKSLGSAGISFKKTWATSNGPCRDTQSEKREEKPPPLSPTALTEKMNASSIGGHKVKSTHKGKIMNKSLCEWCHRGARSRGIASLFVCCFSKGHLSRNRSHMHRI